MAKQLNVNVAVTADTGQAKAQLQDLQNTLKQLSANSANLNLNLDSKSIQQATEAVDKLQLHLKNATNVNTGTLDFAKLSSSIKAGGSTLQEYGNQLLKLGPQGQQAFSQLTQAIAKSEVPMSRIKGMLGEFGTVLSNTIRWQMASSAIHGMMGSIQGAFRYAQDLNESLNRIQIVTQNSDESMAKFAATANKAAKQLSTTTTTYTDAALIYYQQGLSDKEVEERTNVTIKMANAAGTSAKTVSDQMTAVWNNFADGSKSLEYYADVMTALGAATASSTDEISTGLSKFAAVADTVGLSYENAAAALATITATTRQSADSVGTGLRTLFSRLQSVKLGETLEDGVDLTKYTKALQTVGVSALDATGELRSMDDILDDLGGKWQNLTDTQKTALAQTVGGVRQYTTLIALMDNYDFYRQNQQVALGSEGTVQKQADIYAKSWEASQKRVKASAESLYSTLINDDFFIGLNNSFSGIISFINQIIAGLGGIRTLLPSILSLATSLFNDKITSGMVNMVDSLKMLMPGASKKFAAERESFLENAASAMLGITDKSKLTESQSIQLGFAQKELEFQQAYIKNQGVMSSFDKQYAQQQMDNYSNLRQQYKQNQQALESSQFKQGETRASLRTAAFFARNPYEAESEAVKLAKYRYEKSEGQLLSHWFDPKTGKFDTNKYWEDAGKGIDEFTDKINKIEDAKNLVKNFTDTSDEGIAKLTNRVKELTGKDIDFSNLVANGQVNKDAVRAQMLSLSEEQKGLVTDFAANWGLNINAVKEYSAAIIEANGNAEKQAALAKQIKENEEAAGKAVNKRNKTMETAQTITTAAQGMMSLSSAASSAYTLTGNLFDLFNGKGTASVSSLISGFTTLSSTILMTMRGFSALNSIQAFAGLPALLISIASVALPVILQAIDQVTETPEEKLERLTTEAENSEQAANEAARAYQNLMSQKSQHEGLLNSLKELTQGTLEYRDALMQANALANDIITNNNLIFGKDWTVGSTGEYIINESAYQTIGERDLTASENAAIIKGIDAAKLEALKDNNIIESNLQDVQKTLTEQIGIFTKNLSGQEKDINGLGLLLNAYAEWLISEGRLMTDKTIEGFRNRVTTMVEGEGAQDSYWLTKWQAINNKEIYDDYANQFYNQIMAPYIESQTSTITQTNTNLVGLLNNIASSTDKNIDSIDSFVISTLEQQYETQGKFEELYNSQKEAIVAQGREATIAEYKDLYGLSDDMALPDKYYKNGEIDTGKDSQLVKDLTALRVNSTLTAKFAQYRNKLLDLGIRNFDVYGHNIREISEEVGHIQESQAKAEDKKDQKLLQDYSQSLVNQAQATQFEYGTTLGQIFGEQTSAFYDDIKSEIGDKGFEDIKLSDMKAITEFGSSWNLQYGNKVAQSIYKELTKSAINNTGLVDAFRDISTGSTILGTMVNIRNTAKDKGLYGGETKQSIDNIIESFQDQYNSAALFQDLYNSEDFKPQFKELQKVYKKTGKIGADALLSISDESEELALLLEDNEINAQGLADALELIESPDNAIRGVEDLTQRLLKALSAAGALDNTISNAFSFIDNFQAERSITDIGKFYKGLTDTVIGSFEKSFIADSPLLQAYQEFFGPDAMAKYYADAAKYTSMNISPDEISSNLYKDNKEYFDVIRKVNKDGNLSALWDFYATQNEAIGKLFTDSMNDYGQVVMKDFPDLEDILGEHFNTTDLVNYLTSQGISENIANALIAEYSKTNVALDNYLRTSDFSLGLETLFENINNDEIINASTVQGFLLSNAAILKTLTFEDFKSIFSDTEVGKNFTEGFWADIENAFTEAQNGDSIIKDFTNILSTIFGEFGTTVMDLGDIRPNIANLEELANAYNQFIGKINEGKKESEQLPDFEEYLKGSSNGFKDIQKTLTTLGVTDTIHQFELMDQALQAGTLTNEDLNYSYTDLHGNMQTLTKDINDVTQGYGKWLHDNGDIPDTVANYANYIQSVLDADAAQKAIEQQVSVLTKSLTEVFNNSETPFEIQIKFPDDTSKTISSQLNDLTTLKDTFISGDGWQIEIPEVQGQALTDFITEAQKQWGEFKAEVEKGIDIKVNKDMENAFDSANQAIEKANIAVATAQAAAEEAKAAAKEAKAAAENSETSFESAQAQAEVAIGKAEAAAEAQVEAIQAVTDAQNAVTAAQEQVTAAQNARDDAKTAYDNASDAEKEAAKQALDAANAKVAAAEAAEQAALNNLAQAQANADALAQTSADVAEALAAAADAANQKALAAQEAGEATVAADWARLAQTLAGAAKEAATTASETANTSASESAVSASESATSATSSSESATSSVSASESAASSAEKAAQAAELAASIVAQATGAGAKSYLDSKYEGRAVQIQNRYSEEQLGWLTEYAKWSASQNEGRAQALTKNNWQAFSEYASETGLGMAPPWATGILGLGASGVKNWMPDGSAGITNIPFLQDLLAYASTLEQIKTNTGTEKTPPQMEIESVEYNKNIKSQEESGVFQDQYDFTTALLKAGINPQNYEDEANFGRAIDNFINSFSEQQKENPESDYVKEMASAVEAIIKARTENTADTTLSGNKVAVDQILGDQTVEVTAKITKIDESGQETTIDVTAKITNVEEQEDGTYEVTMEGDEASLTELQNQLTAMGVETQLEIGVDGEPSQLKAKIDEQNGRQLKELVDGNTDALKGNIDAQDGRHITVTVDYVPGDTSGLELGPDKNGASGINNGNGAFAGGKHSNAKDYQGLATVGELGPELQIHRGMPFLVGIHGRTKTYVEPGDSIFTAAETQRILDEHPTLQDIPGFAGGSTGYGTGFHFGPGSGGGGEGKNKKTKEFDPERYHLITRQLADLTRWYERLNKIKDKAFGKNKIKAIEDEITATNELIKAQQALIDEAEKYREQDLKRLDELGIKYELDPHGNLLNFEELQEEYGRKATEAEDEDEKKAATDRWKAIQQYEETIDKLNEAQEGMADYIMQLSELELEAITVEVEYKVEYDQRAIDYLQHFIDKLNDNIYETAAFLQLTGAQVDTLTHKIDSYYQGINGIFEKLHDQEGKKIEGMTLEKFLALSPEERENLKVNADDIEKVDGYLQEMLDVVEELDDKKLTGLDKIKQGFDELNDAVEKQIELFEHYNSLLDSVQNIADLTGTKFTDQAKAINEAINDARLKNTINNLTSLQERYKAIATAREDLYQQYLNETDETSKKAYKEEYDRYTDYMNNLQEQIFSEHANGLQAAADIFQSMMEDVVKTYENSFSKLGDLSFIQGLYDRQKQIDEQYANDYEKYYRLSKLERDINKTIDTLSISSGRRNKALSEILKEVNEAQKDGREMSEYDLELLRKKYEVEKARAELEEARDAKSTVRLQRNNNGTWGYVYTANEDNVAELEQKLEDSVYELQKFNEDYNQKLIDSFFRMAQDMGDLVSGDVWQLLMSPIEEERNQGFAQIEKINEQYGKISDYTMEQIRHAWEGNEWSLGLALEIYKDKMKEDGTAFDDLTTNMTETTLSKITGKTALEDWWTQIAEGISGMTTGAEDAIKYLMQKINEFNEAAGVDSEDIEESIMTIVDSITHDSDETADSVTHLADDMKTTISEIIAQAQNWEEAWLPIIHNITEQTEVFITTLGDAINELGLGLSLMDAYNLGTLAVHRQDQGLYNKDRLYIENTSSKFDEVLPQYDSHGNLIGYRAIKEEDTKLIDTGIINMESILSSIDMAAMTQPLGVKLNVPAMADQWKQMLEQEVTIHAEFPNVTDHYEIEQAFNNLVNKATQYANEKRNG